MDKEKYEELLMQYQLTLSGVSLDELELHAKALSEYYTQRLMCEQMCGGCGNGEI